VLSGDSDLLVLASDDCDVYQFGRKGEERFQRRSPEWICGKYGIASPQQLRAYKAIVGESGEGVPGLTATDR
jgi:5'-3' exonuclease